MSGVSAAIGAHHRELTDKLAEQAAALAEGAADADGLVTYLTTELLPHAAGEERHLYPVVDDLIKRHGDATATMRLDHAYIETTTRQIEELARALRAATTEEERAARRTRLVRLASQLEAVLRLHVEKEERAYLPLFEAYLPVEEQRRILDAMHEGAGEGHGEGAAAEAADRELDVRSLPPAERHALIFRTFDALPAGETFVLVNDHDPKPLYYQLTFERKGSLRWEYLEQGPEDWRVRIGKAA